MTRSINPNLGKRRFNSRLTLDQYLEGIQRHDRSILSRAITLIESTRADDQALARALIQACLPKSGNSIRIGITGSPGVGKSTFIETLGLHWLEQGKNIGVLAIDPSSQITKGSILGDKTRMGELSSHPGAFIRPSPAGTSLGGVARTTRESILLCEAAGFDLIIVETVGVGQSEIAVHSMTDLFLLLLQPGAGDELQGIKRGIVEMADLFIVNKADGDQLNAAKRTAQAYQNAIHLFPPKDSGQMVPVFTCSALEQNGISAIIESILQYQINTQANQFWQQKRDQQALYWFEENIQVLIKDRMQQNDMIRKAYQELRERVKEGTLSPYDGANQLLQLLF